MLNVECLMDDVDVSSKMTRELFEQKSASILERVKLPLQQVGGRFHSPPAHYLADSTRTSLSPSWSGRTALQAQASVFRRKLFWQRLTSILEWGRPPLEGWNLVRGVYRSWPGKQGLPEGKKASFQLLKQKPIRTSNAGIVQVSSLRLLNVCVYYNMILYKLAKETPYYYAEIRVWPGYCIIKAKGTP